mgnify:CR=1 FL=1
MGGCWPAARCLPLPDGVGFAEAAAVQIAHGTAHLALDHRAGLRPGETLFVTGAAGGVGLAAVEIGRRMGARVIASARGAERLFDAFATLPGIEITALLAALDAPPAPAFGGNVISLSSERPGTGRLIWRRPARAVLT